MRKFRSITGPLIALGLVTFTACSVQGGSSGGDGGAEYPSEPVEVLVGSEAGGSTDILMRGLAKSLEQPLGTKVVVINKPGANGKIAGQDVFGSEPDGYRLVMMPQSLMAIGPLMLDDPDPLELEDMSFVKGLAIEDYVMVTSPDSKYETLDDVTAAGNVKYGTTGAGTGSQLAQALLFGVAKTNAEPVPFDGGAPAMTAVLGGKVDVATVQIAEAAQQVKAGKVRPLAVFADERVAAFEDVPTATEEGYDVVVDQRRFLAGPPGLPADVKDKLVSAIDKATASPEYQRLLESNYIDAWDANGDETRAQLQESRARFEKLIDELGVDVSEAS